MATRTVEVAARRAGAFRRTRSDLAETHQGEAFEWPRSHSRRIAYHSEISRRTLISAPETPLLPIAPRARGNGRHRGSNRNRKTHQPPNRRGSAAHRRRSFFRRWADTSAISFAGLCEFAEPLLGMVNELAREASFPEGEFERERRQKLEEVKLERTQPGFLAGERLRKVLFGAHPYAQVSPSEAQVAAYKREDLQSVYREFYTPENGLLLLVGDFDPHAMLKTAEKVFGDWTGKKPLATEYRRATRIRSGRRVYLVHVPGAVQTQILAGCHAITRKHPDWVKLGLTNSLYGGAFNSRLVMNIREDKGYTYSPRSGVNALRQHGYFSVSAAVRNDVVAASLTEIFYEMDKLRSVPVPEAELADAQNYLSGVFSMGLATQDGLLSQISTVALNELPDDYLETYREKVRAAHADRLAGRRRENISIPQTCKSSSSATARKSNRKPLFSANWKFSTRKARDSA